MTMYRKCSCPGSKVVEGHCAVCGAGVEWDLTGRLSIVRDEDCPQCGYPETYAAGPEATGPDVLGCRKCGWSTAIASSQEG